MKIIVTTSNAYLHLIPVFEYLYMKYWGAPDIEIVGYEKPATNLPFVSLGTQGHVSEWSTDLRRYFEKQPDWFVWLMEDTIIKAPIDQDKLKNWKRYCIDWVGKIDLTNDVCKRLNQHLKHGTAFRDDIRFAMLGTPYRQSTQPAIWNKHFLLKYLTNGLTPWDFETQPTNDGYMVLGTRIPTVVHNEGVRRFDPYKLDLTGLPEDDIAHIKSIAPWLK